MTSERNLNIAVVLCVVALSATTLFAQADLDQLRFEDERQHNALLDQEKWLLQDNDSLQRDIDRLKIEVEEKVRKISLAQHKLDKVRHDLITVRMKLMP